MKPVQKTKTSRGDGIGEKVNASAWEVTCKCDTVSR
jgi:hypothetical protein